MFDQFKVQLASCGIMLLATATFARADEPADVLTVESAVAMAVQNNPGLEEMRQRAQAAARVPSQVGSLPDPRINLGAANLPVNSFALGQEPMTQLQLGVMQAFPFPGKLALRREVAESEAAAVTDSSEEARLKLIRDVRSGWWDLYYLERATDTIARNRERLKELVEVARTRYAVGQGLQQDVLLAQVELARLLDMQIRIDGMHDGSRARLNALLARPVDAATRLPDVADASLPEIASEALLQKQAGQSRALLAQAQHQLEAADAAQALARKEYLPEFGLSVGYGQRQGSNADGSRRPDFASVMLSFSVPVFVARRQNQLIAQRLAERNARERALADAGNRVRAEISTAAADYRRARQELALLDHGILPQTTQAVESMLAGYQVGKVDFLTLVRTQVTLYDYELRRWQALAEANQALARLAAAVGQENLR